MEIVFNKDSSFFFIESDDLIAATKKEKSITRLINNDVISFSVTEELGKIATGNLLLRDNDHIYSFLFRSGMKFNLTWGYKKWNKDFTQLGISKTNPNELLGSGERKGLRCIIQSPGGGGNNQGETTYNVTFMGSEFLIGKEIKKYGSGTRKDVITSLFEKLEIKPTDVYINFKTEAVNLDSATAIPQRESAFNMLLNLSYEWHTLFQISYKPDGSRLGLFIDPHRVDEDEAKRFIKEITGATGNQRTLYYRDGDRSNVMSYSWQNNIGASGQGSGVRLLLVDGKVIAQKYKAETQTVIVWTMDEKVINERLAREGLSLKTLFSKNFLSAKDFKNIQWAFDAFEERSAPDGMGYTINAKMHGDPLLMMPLRIYFKKSFPSSLTQDRNKKSLIKFYLRKATHTINSKGYFMDIEIADTYTITGSFVQNAGKAI